MKNGREGFASVPVGDGRFAPKVNNFHPTRLLLILRESKRPAGCRPQPAGRTRSP